MPVTHAVALQKEAAALDAQPRKKAMVIDDEGNGAASDATSSISGGGARDAKDRQTMACGKQPVSLDGADPGPRVPAGTRTLRELSKLSTLIQQTAWLYEVELYEDRGQPVVFQATSDIEILDMLSSMVPGGSSAPSGEQSEERGRDTAITREELLSMRPTRGMPVQYQLKAASCSLIAAAGSYRGASRPAHGVNGQRAAKNSQASGTYSDRASSLGSSQRALASHAGTGPAQSTVPDPLEIQMRFSNAVPWGNDASDIFEDEIVTIAESVASQDDDDDAEVQVVVGPTHLSVAPMEFHQIKLPDRELGGRGVTIRSSQSALRLSDARRLGQARAEAPASFGSARHVAFGPTKEACRPCMFERWPGRCTKAWLCDFCHMHAKKAKRDRQPRSNGEVSL